ncbi:purine-nucleoside phosphorylase [Conchiformibius kuhniae]|uniref:Purine nucleoside phosphorylase DeoD-type n=1 Tax=Conchiformibius kuhniae TaxID=211502 RepID=A0A8T9MW62_9NEIS|nr:purine-nucleoside phosphorylase [Conchiformibius kuhniae]UOP05075.1 purine-nucleoside phosphorylase [Conchiformibius kuhniae]
MPTPHIAAPQGAFAPTVLMPGDPLRARYIAETFLDHAEQITAVRNMYGYTGTYRGKRLSVMGHGMGIPSCSIYAKELITEYGVQNLIRVGSCGAVLDDVHVRDVVIGLSASTDSQVNRSRFRGYDFAATADFGLTQALAAAAQAHNTAAKVGNLFSTDLFYHPDAGLTDTLRRYGILGVEMEAAGLFGVAAEFGAKAACICTVSDHIVREEYTSAEERQRTFNDMIRIALEAAAQFA